MARDITSGFSQEISAQRLAPIVLAKAEFDSGDVNLWSGYGNIIWNGDTYLGA